MKAQKVGALVGLGLLASLGLLVSWQSASQRELQDAGGGRILSRNKRGVYFIQKYSWLQDFMWCAAVRIYQLMRDIDDGSYAWDEVYYQRVCRDIETGRRVKITPAGHHRGEFNTTVTSWSRLPTPVMSSSGSTKERTESTTTNRLSTTTTTPSHTKISTTTSKSTSTTAKSTSTTAKSTSTTAKSTSRTAKSTSTTTKTTSTTARSTLSTAKSTSPAAGSSTVRVIPPSAGGRVHVVTSSTVTSSVSATLTPRKNFSLPTSARSSKLSYCTVTSQYDVIQTITCPKDGQSVDYNYCCGPVNNQHCCRFIDHPGWLACIIISVALVIVILIFCWYCKVKKKMKKKVVIIPGPTRIVAMKTVIGQTKTGAVELAKPPPYDVIKETPVDLFTISGSQPPHTVPADMVFPPSQAPPPAYCVMEENGYEGDYDTMSLPPPYQSTVDLRTDHAH